MRPITISLYIILTFALLIALTGGAYANGTEDKTDRLSQNQSYTFSPGYINAAKQRADDIVRQSTEKKPGFMEQAMEYIKNILGRNIKEEQSNKPEPKLQMKSSQEDTSMPAATDGVVIIKRPAASDDFGPSEDPSKGSSDDIIVSKPGSEPPPPGTSGTATAAGLIPKYPKNSTPRNNIFYTGSNDYNITPSFMSVYANHAKGLDEAVVSSVFEGILAKKDDLGQGEIRQIDPALLKKIVEDSLAKSTLSLPDGQVNPELMEMAMRLASIMHNPTEDQQMILESITSLLQDTNKVEQEAGQSPELTQAQDNLIQMVANVLLAQAMPDLISKGEMTNIKNIFKELDTQKTRIMQSYSDATKPYYDSIKKDLEKNMAVLELTGIFSKGMLEQELRDASRSQIEKIIDNLKKSSEKSFEKDYILQQEDKYKDKYLDPNRERLESDMRNMMNNFTGRLQEALEAKK